MQESGLSESRYYDITGVHDGNWIKYMQEKFYIENEHYIHTKRQMTEEQLDEWIPRLAFVHISKLLEKEQYIPNSNILFDDLINKLDALDLEEKEISSFEQLMDDLNTLDEKEKTEGNTKESRKEQIIKEQRKIYQGNMEKENNNGNIRMIDIRTLSDEELENTFFHYSLKKDKNSIDKNGLETRIGRNSEGIDKLSSIYFSYGLEGALETWDVWLKWRANRLYNPYWQEENKDIVEKLKNGTATEQEKKEYHYKAELWNEEFSSGKYREDKEKMEFLFDFQMDEMLTSNYYLLDLKEGEDFSFDEVDVKKEANLKRKDKPNDIGYKIFKEMYGSYSDFDTSKVDKWNMNTFLGKQITIDPDRIKQLTTPDGKNNVLSVVTYLYEKYKEITPKERQIKFDLLDNYMEYVKEKTHDKDFQEFNRNDRIDEASVISYFHDQKSDNFFQDKAGVYPISDNLSNSILNRVRSSNQKARDVEKTQSEIKINYKEIENPTQDKDSKDVDIYE